MDAFRLGWAWVALVVGCSERAAPVDAAAAAGVEQVGQAAEAAQNLVLITVDTLRADALALYGGPVATPGIESLAAEGWLFERCFSTSMLTNPAHVSIFTSLYPRDHGVYDNESGVHDGARTLATELLRQGFRTAAVVNFPHLNANVANLVQGFERFVPAERRERSATEVTRLGLELIDEMQGGRFFLWLHYTEPHAPYEPPRDVALPRVEGRTPMREVVRAAPRFQRSNTYFKQAFRRHRYAEELVQRYFGEVAAVDRGIAALLAGLGARGQLDATAVVLTSDHGENLGEHGLYFHHGGLYRETVHVPLVVRASGARPRRIAALVQTIDIAPTVTELLGVARWEPMRGDSLVPLATRAEGGRRFVFTEHMLGQLASVRTEAASMILHHKDSRQFPTYPFRAGHRELYALDRDPHELEALPAQGALADELGVALSRYLNGGTHLVAKRAEAPDRESLRALGYVE